MILSQWKIDNMSLILGLQIMLLFEGESQGSGSFYLKHRVHAAGSDSRKMSAKYSIALQYLVLEGIVEDDAHL